MKTINSKEKVVKAVETCFDNWLWRYKDYFSQVTMDEVRELKADALALLKEQPEIVRCKDCSHGDDTIINGKYLFKTCGGINHEPDWFCADGKRRDDDA